MRPFVSIVLSIVLAVEAATVSTNARCGSANNGMTCLNSRWGSCCSQYGWCGWTKDYCQSGCQPGFGTCSGGFNPSSIVVSRSTLPTSTRSATPSSSQAPVSNNGRCGALYGGQTCQGSSYGNCCSQYNYCGKTNGHCTTGCQSAFGTCTRSSFSAVRPSTSTSQSSTVRVSSTSSHAPSASSTQPVSKNARCGAGFGGQTCQGSQWGDCCSQYFYCGSTYDYCGAHSCQKGYGKCDSVSTSPNAFISSTSSSFEPISSSISVPTSISDISDSSTSSFSESASSSVSITISSSEIGVSSTSSYVDPTSSSISVPTSSLEIGVSSTSSSFESTSSSISIPTSSSEIIISSTVSSSSSDIISSSSSIEASSSVGPTSSLSSEVLSSSISPTPSSTELASSTVASSTAPSLFPTGVNVLLNPGFEDITASGPSGAMIDWQSSGRVYPNRLQAAAREGQTYAILNHQLATPAAVYQTLTGFDTTRPYALTFYWNLHSINFATSCTLSVSLGNVIFYTVVLTAADDPRPYNWKGPFTSTPVIPSSLTETLRFDYSCIPSGQGNLASYIFLDSLSLVSS